MKKLLRFADGHIVELSPITYDEFVATEIWQGASDMAFANYLRANNWQELSDFKEESLEKAQVYLEGFPLWREMQDDHVTVTQLSLESAFKEPIGLALGFVFEDSKGKRMMSLDTRITKDKIEPLDLPESDWRFIKTARPSSLTPLPE